MVIVSNETLIEVRLRARGGVGLVRQDWPLTVHRVARLGRLEVRVISPKGEACGVVGTVALVGMALVSWVGGGK